MAMSGIPDMTPMALAAPVAPRTGKPLKMASAFLKEEKICYQIVYYTLYLSLKG